MARRRRHVEGTDRHVNGLASKLTYQVRNIDEVTTAVFGRPLAQAPASTAQGEILE